MQAEWDADSEEEGEYEVRELKAVRGTEGAREYLVSWAGYEVEDDTWEPEYNLHADTGIASYSGYAQLRECFTLRERAQN